MANRYNVQAATGTFNGVAAASKVNGNTVQIGADTVRVRDLSAIVVVDAETNTFTVAPEWQVCNTSDGTFLPIMPSNAAANVVIATGTSGADATVSRVISAPDGVYGWRFARMSLVAGGTTGTSDDTYSISYCFRQVP